MVQWPVLLAGIPFKVIKGNIHSINVRAMGPAQVGPYVELCKFVKATTMYKMPVEVHHIVNGEHLDNKLWNYNTAPCVVMDKGMHQQYHARFSETMPDYGGRGMLEPLPQNTRLELYHDMFEQQTGWHELWIIAARIITGSMKVPSPHSFVTR
jgi:hypothetical protein